jgi:membrane associated rhomboid family serine protease
MMPIKITRAVKALLISYFVIFIVQQTADQFFDTNLLGWLGLVPSAFALQQRFWQLFTYAFLHADVMHLFFNLLMLVFIGGELEALWGAVRFIRYYFFCSISAGVLYLFLVYFWKGAGLNVPMVGASAGIYGLLVAYGLIFGERVLLFMLLFPMKAKHFVWILAAVEFLTTVYSGRGSGLSSAAHLGGMIAGFGYLWIRASYKLAQKNRQESKVRNIKAKKQAKSHLKLIIDNEHESERFMREDRSKDPKTWH